MSKISTPYEKISVVDQISGLRLGCGRSIPEFARWTAFGEGGRPRMMSQLPGRLDALLVRRATRAQS